MRPFSILWVLWRAVYRALLGTARDSMPGHASRQRDHGDFLPLATQGEGVGRSPDAPSTRTRLLLVTRVFDSNWFRSRPHSETNLSLLPVLKSELAPLFVGVHSQRRVPAKHAGSY